MADSKRYDGSTWNHSLRKLKTATEAVEIPLYSNGAPITNYTIKGNILQNGEPSKVDPATLLGVGELDDGQYKIPISNGDVTTNIYLGNNQTSRRIKKLVLTGGADEIWNHAGNGIMYRTDISDYLREAVVTSVCTHYPCNVNVPSSTATQYGVSFITSSSYNRLYIKDSSFSTATDFKNWLATEYYNGTPVIVYYVLSAPETVAINEPLMKIGDYADTLSNAVQIPTTEGANNITVDTTVQPSEFTATWTGWHNANVKEWDGQNWA